VTRVFCWQVQLDTALIEVLNLFVSRHVSSLPVVDQQRRVLDVYAKFDVIVSQNNHNNYLTTTIIITIVINIINTIIIKVIIRIIVIIMVVMI